MTHTANPGAAPDDALAGTPAIVDLDRARQARDDARARQLDFEQIEIYDHLLGPRPGEPGHIERTPPRVQLTDEGFQYYRHWFQRFGFALEREPIVDDFFYGIRNINRLLNPPEPGEFLFPPSALATMTPEQRAAAEALEAAALADDPQAVKAAGDVLKDAFAAPPAAVKPFRPRMR